jgi:predicted PurR-regulated permease PerM
VPEVAPVVPSGASNFTRAQVPHGIDLAAAWSWRFLVIVAAGWVVAQGVQMVSVVLLPVVVALFLAALAVPAVSLLTRFMSRGVAALVVLIGLIGLVALMLTFATRQVVGGFGDLADQVVEGLDEIQVWLQDGPLKVTDAQVSDLLDQMQELVASSNEEIVSRVSEVGSAVGHIVAGFFIVLFALYFFLADGDRIWTWVVRLFPRAARSRADSSGRVAWLSLTQFIRATVLVAAVDAVGIMIVAAVLSVPFVMAIGVLVFLGGFVPLVGATVTGAVAVLVALVAQGPLAALLMLLGVIGVQQLEAHVLQPFLLGRMVSIHPLAVILAVASGVLIAGIAGALVAVPVVACVNAVAVHLAGHHDENVSEGAETVLTDTEEAQDPDAGGAT